MSSRREATAEPPRHQRQNNGNDVAEIMCSVREQGQAARQDATDEFSQRDGHVESGAGPESPVQRSVAGKGFMTVTHGELLGLRAGEYRVCQVREVLHHNGSAVLAGAGSSDRRSVRRLRDLRFSVPARCDFNDR